MTGLKVSEKLINNLTIARTSNLFKDLGIVMAKSTARATAPTRQQRQFAAVYAETGSARYSAAAAGYSLPDTNHPRIMANPVVQQTVRQIQERRILNDLMPKALDLLERAIGDETWKPEVRIKAAAEVRQWYGQVTGGAGQDKAPEDMSPDELAARIATLRARQAQLAEGAKVIEHEPEPDVFG